MNLDAERAGRDPDALDRLSALVESDMARVNQIILKQMQSPVALIPELAGHIIAAGGKRLRPILTLAAARMCGYRGEHHQTLAACVEFIHTATLLHDDVVDDSALRRGQDSANVLWGNKPSVLVGDFLFSRAFQLMVQPGSLRVLEILSSASAVMPRARCCSSSPATTPRPTELAYLEVIKGKTAALFSAACEVGAVIAERPKTEQEALSSYGLNLGIAFPADRRCPRLHSAKQEALGKTVGDDSSSARARSPSPVILAFLRGGARRAHPSGSASWKPRSSGRKTSRRPSGLMTRHGALKDTVLRAAHYGAMAKDALGIFKESAEKRALTEVVDSLHPARPLSSSATAKQSCVWHDSIDALCQWVSVDLDFLEQNRYGP